MLDGNILTINGKLVSAFSLQLCPDISVQNIINTVHYPVVLSTDHQAEGPEVFFRQNAFRAIDCIRFFIDYMPKGFNFGAF